jgi:hypothetical protein
MRSMIAVLTVFVALVAAHPARSENRLFIVANNPDGYGIDRCLARGEACGVAVATSFCRAREYSTAHSFRKVDPDDITGAVPVNGQPHTCKGRNCDEFVAIECTR